MIIKAVDTAFISVPLKRAFKTAVRESLFAQSVIVRVLGEDGLCGYGEAAVAPAVTGETRAGIEAAIRLHLAPAVIGRNTMYFDEIMRSLYSSVLHNSCAKAALDTALYDLVSRENGVTLRGFLGGGVNCVDTCLTISLNSAQEMAADSASAVLQGFKALKLKLGGSEETDLQRAAAVREAVGPACMLIADANQGWGAKQAVHIISQMEDMGLDIKLFEQPVAAWNTDALRFVTKNVLTPVAADESVLSHHDAARLLSNECADIINIKLMKAGGIYGALKICETAAAFGVQCMLGCMLETGLAVNSAAQLAAARPCIAWRDLDAPFLCAEYGFGGADFNAGEIYLPSGAGTACCAAELFLNEKEEII